MEKLPIQITLDESFFLLEEKCGYQVTLKSKQLWAVLLDLLVKFDSVCRKNGIPYSLDSGTLLGAVRHKGFIPWDNDADVIMLRSDYDRLCNIASSEFEEPYFWQTNETDPGSLRRHAQLRNSQTTDILMSETDNGTPLYNYNQGVFLDVFILDEVPDDRAELMHFCNELECHLNLLWDIKQCYRLSGASAWMTEAQRQAYRQFEQTVSRYNGTHQHRVGNVSLIPSRKESTLFDKTIFDDLVDYPFEDFHFLGPRDYETVLSGFYGDWHQLVIGADAHGQVILDLYKPYTSYLKSQKPVMQQLADKEHPVLTLLRRYHGLKEGNVVAFTDENQRLKYKIKHLRRKIKLLAAIAILLMLILLLVIFL